MSTTPAKCGYTIIHVFFYSQSNMYLDKSKNLVLQFCFEKIAIPLAIHITPELYTFFVWIQLHRNFLIGNFQIIENKFLCFCVPCHRIPFEWQCAISIRSGIAVFREIRPHFAHCPHGCVRLGEVFRVNVEHFEARNSNQNIRLIVAV